MKKLAFVLTALLMTLAMMIIGAPKVYAAQTMLSDYIFDPLSTTFNGISLTIEEGTNTFTLNGTSNNSGDYNLPNMFTANANGSLIEYQKKYAFHYEYISGDTNGSTKIIQISSTPNSDVRAISLSATTYAQNLGFLATYSAVTDHRMSVYAGTVVNNLTFKLHIIEVTDHNQNDFTFFTDTTSTTVKGVTISFLDAYTVVMNGTITSGSAVDILAKVNTEIINSDEQIMITYEYVSGSTTDNALSIGGGNWMFYFGEENMIRGRIIDNLSSLSFGPGTTGAYSNFTFKLHAQVIELYTESNTPGESTTPPTGVTLSGSFYQDKVYFNTVTENPFTVYPAVYLATTTGDTFDLNILTENLVFVSADANIRFYIGRIAGGEENIGGTGDFVIRKDATNVYIEKLVDSVEQDEVYVPLSDFDFFMIETIPPAAETWTVSFMSEGVILSTQEIDDLATASIPTAPTRAGYNFVNWVLDPLDHFTVYEFATPVTADLMLYAYWEPNGATVYEVSFITDGGTAVSPIAVEDGDLASAPTPPIRSGYTFLHWVVTGTSDVFSFSIPITGNISLTAVWEESGEIFYIITFIENGGSAIQDQIVNDGDLPVEPTDPTRTGYLFMGWYSDIALTSAYIFDAAPTADMTLYAKWTPVSGGGDPIAEDPASSGSVWLYVGLGAAALAVLAGSQANPKKGKRR